MATQDSRVPMTSRGYQFLMDELKRLKSVERPKNVREIEEARGHGDLSENAEFHAAKERQSLLDVQIRDIEDKLARPLVIRATRWYIKSWAIMRRSQRTERFQLALLLPGR